MKTAKANAIALMPERRWYQHRLRTLLLVLVATAMGMGAVNWFLLLKVRFFVLLDYGGSHFTARPSLACQCREIARCWLTKA